MEHKVHHRPSCKESPNAAMQFVNGVLEEILGERNRDFPKSEVDPIPPFTFNDAIETGQSGYESLAQLHNPKEATNWGEQLRPQTAQDMCSYDYDMSDDDDPLPSKYTDQQSMSPVKGPVKGRDFCNEGFFLVKKMLRHHLCHRRKEPRARLCVCDTLAWIWCIPHLHISGQLISR